MAREEDIDIVARTAYGEARGEGSEGLYAVCCVIRNRVRDPGWWGNTWSSVCLKRAQFSCWNPGDPNRAVIEQVNESEHRFRMARKVAQRVIDGSPDITDGATHYHTRDVAPAWSQGRRPTMTIGAHLFYKIGQG